MTGVEEERQQVNRIDQRETADQCKEKQAKGRCFRCDRERHFSRDSCCPARNAECHKCHKIGHFPKVCQTKTATSKKGFPPREVPNKRRLNVNSIDVGDLRALLRVMTTCTDSLWAAEKQVGL